MPPNGAENTSGLVTCIDTIRIGRLAVYKQTFGLANSFDGKFSTFFAFLNQ